MIPPEPQIRVNGHDLTEAQALVVRVALSHLLGLLCDRSFQTALGTTATGYEARGNEVLALMLSGNRVTDDSRA